jgi:tRNA/rRNA methyltransferase
MAALAHRLTVVLHQVRSPDNLGAVARLMANFGVRDLVLSDPATLDFYAAQKMAVRGQRALEELRLCRTLDEALQGCVYACGTTSRETARRRTVLTPEEAIERLAEHAERGPVALVFGGEKRGLSDEELARCPDVLAIATTDEQPSMNLAQAAAVMLYLASRTEAKRAAAPNAEATPNTDAAPMKLQQLLETRMKEALLAAGFLNPQAPDHVLGELWRTLSRSSLTLREAELWLGAFASVRRLGSQRAPDETA